MYSQMLVEMNISDDPKQIGYYAGFVESLYAVAQLCTAIFWGRLSDHVGRKPIMLIGLSAMAISTIFFGFQTTYLGLIICRFVAGMMNALLSVTGNIGVLQSIVAEMTDETNHASAVALLPLCFATGSIIGPLIGGFLAFPAQNFPSTFGNWNFFINYPYFLPCFAGAMLNIFAIFLGIFFLKETLASKQKKKSAIQRTTVSEGYESLSSSSSSYPDSRSEVFVPPSIGSLCTAPILILLLTFTLTHLQNVAWTAVIPLYAFTGMKDGGLGMSLKQIGMNSKDFSLQRISQIEPKFHSECEWYRGGLGSAFPFLTSSKKIRGSDDLQAVNPDIYSHFYVSSPGDVFSPTFSQAQYLLYVNWIYGLYHDFEKPRHHVLSPASLGTLNGMMQFDRNLISFNHKPQTCRSFAQAVGPILGSSLFALSVSEQILGGNLVWIVLALVSIFAELCSRQIPSDRAITMIRVQSEVEHESEI
ncbi:uncharacterized protein MELLADRAFT_94765 [Melampsora larici-populina 98AG31]|uniref:Major facilitator superfamily (MFS) profile domain-containing protein n=1 Tax=Melampsora larici-populina (strain 98AG31 / pathotype 3-4-7) TaxID=747676 RepID=F4S7U6_MELLP|nr:uncharacterized protein MELLADRAFT_94765 [Melampsora larici-populina 98AG31]EGF99299.1 hypothetical protein MELLADRAFT_94765 [Melampsora larici-populina 98AG31]